MKWYMLKPLFVWLLLNVLVFTKSKFCFYLVVFLISSWQLFDHQKSVSNPNVIATCIHFEKEEHNFIQHARFTFMEQLTETENINKAILNFQLKQKEDYWISKLDTLTPKGLSPEL